MSVHFLETPRQIGKSHLAKIIDEAQAEIADSSYVKAINEAMKLAEKGVTPRAAIYLNHACWGGVDEPSWEDALMTVVVKHRVRNARPRVIEEGETS